MERLQLTPMGNYKNKGQDKEQALRFVLTGQVQKADNRKADKDGDCQGIQIKSDKATLGKGDNLTMVFQADTAERFAYVDRDYVAYIMTRREWKAFIERFAYQDKSSQGSRVYRLRETVQMRVYLKRQPRKAVRLSTTKDKTLVVESPQGQKGKASRTNCQGRKAKKGFP